MRYKINAPNVIADNMDGEYVILNMESGRYYSALETGAIAWQLLSNTYTLEETIAIFSSKYPVPKQMLSEELKAFLAELLENNLLIPSEATTPKVESNLSFIKNYKTPAITIYTDMEGLLLVDPIHEVENTGWPNTKQ